MRVVEFTPSRTAIASDDQDRHQSIAAGVRTAIRRVHMSYVDGFVLPVPKKKLQTYRRMAQKAGKVWRDHGALEFRECVADDVKPGKPTSFPQSVRLKRGETVFFSFIVFKSRAHRDRVNARVM